MMGGGYTSRVNKTPETLFPSGKTLLGMAPAELSHLNFVFRFLVIPTTTALTVLKP